MSNLNPSLNDLKQYLKFTMDNGLTVLLISNNKTERCAVSMDVGVGSFNDPPEYQGLAHFLEHMLFMGSEKYPSENEYSEFMTARGGGSNAFTGNSNTNYHFDILPEYLEEAIDIFA